MFNLRQNNKIIDRLLKGDSQRIIANNYKVSLPTISRLWAAHRKKYGLPERKRGPKGISQIKIDGILSLRRRGYRYRDIRDSLKISIKTIEKVTKRYGLSEKRNRSLTAGLIKIIQKEADDGHHYRNIARKNGVSLQTVLNFVKEEY